MVKNPARFGLLLGLGVCLSLIASDGGAAQRGHAHQAATKSEGVKSDRSTRQLPVETVRRSRIRHGGLTVGGGYTHQSGGYPYYGYPYSWGYYVPFFPAFYHPGYYGGFVRGPGMGQLKLNVTDKLAEVYLNDGYAGTVGDLKSIWLEPGAYNLELRDPEGQTFERRIYVLSGKTVRVTPEFAASSDAAPAENDQKERP